MKDNSNKITLGGKRAFSVRNRVLRVRQGRLELSTTEGKAGNSIKHHQKTPSLRVMNNVSIITLRTFMFLNIKLVVLSDKTIYI